MAWLANDFDPIRVGGLADGLVVAPADAGLQSLRLFHAGRRAALDNARALAETISWSGHGRPAAMAPVRARMGLVREQAVKRAMLIGASAGSSVVATAGMMPEQAG